MSSVHATKSEVSASTLIPRHTYMQIGVVMYCWCSLRDSISGSLENMVGGGTFNFRAAFDNFRDSRRPTESRPTNLGEYTSLRDHNYCIVRYTKYITSLSRAETHVCVHAYIHACIHTCMHACIHPRCMYKDSHGHTHTLTYIHTHTHTHTYTYTYTHTCMNTHTHTDTDACIHACIHTTH